MHRPEDRPTQVLSEIALWVHSLATGFFKGITLPAAKHLASLLGKADDSVSLKHLSS
jgi:hypothetical protein